MRLLKQSSTAQPLVFLLIQSADHITGLTGASPTVTLSKSGGAFAGSAGAVSEIANGWYKVAGNATDTNTLGPLVLHASAASGDPVDIEYTIVSFDPQDAVHLGLSALPNTACTTNASLLTSGTSTDQLSVTSGRIDIGKALGTAITLDANNVLNVNMKNIGADTSAAINLANTFNGTGYVNSNAPAQQQQVTNIAVTSAALNTTSTTNVITTGIESSGTYASTATADQVYNVITAVGNAIDLYYQFTVGTAGGIATSISWLGYLTGATNAVKIYAYNWVGASWDQVGTINGITGTVESSVDYDLTSAHTGTSGNLGLVRIRFAATGLTTGVLNTDRLLVGYAVVTTFPANFSSLSVDASGRVDIGKTLGTAITLDSNNVVNVSTKYLAGTALTGRDVGASVLLSAGTSTGQLDFTSGVVKANTTQWLDGTIPAVNVTGVPLVDAKYLLGTIFSTPATTGIIDVNIKNIANAVVDSTTAQIGTNIVKFGGTTGTFAGGRPEVNTTHIAGTVSAGTAGYMALDWAHISAPTTTQVLSGTTVGISTTVTNQLTAAAIATGVWQDTTAGDFTVASSIGKSLYIANIVPGAAGGHFIAGSNAATTVNFTGSLSGSVGSVTGSVGSIAAGGITTSSLGTFILAKTTNITGFNDIAATSIVSAGAITTSGGSVSTVTTTTTATNLTNAPTSGDFTATMKTSLNAATPASVVGSVGSVTSAVTVGTNNDKTGYSLSQAFPTNFSNLAITTNGMVVAGSVSGTVNVSQWSGVNVTGMPMPTYTQPVGFLAATFPLIVSASGVAGTANVTQWNNVAVSGMPMPIYNQPTGFLAASFPSNIGTSTYSGSDTAGTTTLLSRITGTIPLASDYTSARATKIDNLDATISSAVTAIGNINNLSALANLFVPSVLAKPTSGTIIYPITFIVKDVEGHAIDVDSNTVTITAVNTAGTSRAANLSSVTHSGTGEYVFTYTVSSSHMNEGVRFTASGTVQSATRKAYGNVDVIESGTSGVILAANQPNIVTFSNGIIINGGTSLHALQLNGAASIVGVSIAGNGLSISGGVDNAVSGHTTTGGTGVMIIGGDSTTGRSGLGMSVSGGTSSQFVSNTAVLFSGGQGFSAGGAGFVIGGGTYTGSSGVGNFGMVIAGTGSSDANNGASGLQISGGSSSTGSAGDAVFLNPGVNDANVFGFGIHGDLSGKILGGGSSVITGVGADVNAISLPDPAPNGYGGGGGSNLTGPSSVTLTFHDSSGNPIPSAQFTIVGVGSSQSNGSGIAAFGLSDGTYTVVTAPNSFTSFSNTTLVVSGTTTQTITGTTATIPSPASITQSVGYIYTYDGQGNIAGGIPLNFNLISNPDQLESDGLASFRSVSDDTGLVAETFIRNATYKAWRGTGEQVTFVASGTTFHLPQILG